MAVFENGDVVKGEYDGYGRILTDHGEVDGEVELGYEGEFALYHRACWDHAGCPTKFTAASKHAGDSGFFFDDSSHDFAPPGTPNPEKWVRERQVKRDAMRARQELAEITREWYEIFYEKGVGLE